MPEQFLLDLTKVQADLLQIELELIISMLNLEHGLLQVGQGILLLDIVVAAQLLYPVHQTQCG